MREGNKDVPGINGTTFKVKLNKEWYAPDEFYFPLTEVPVPGLKARLKEAGWVEHYTEPLTLEALKEYLMEVFHRPKGMSKRKWKKHTESLRVS